ncbi:MAG: PAAR domain-containing protein [Bacteroidetes bacterium]|nr:PAAR domain-containing protein [Bacteroidota bacterium]
MPPAARVGDNHICPMANPNGSPHAGGPIMPPGVTTVLIGGAPAAVLGTMCTCAGPPDSIAKGSATVLIGGQPAARLGDSTAHGGSVAAGLATVQIGG